MIRLWKKLALVTVLVSIAVDARAQELRPLEERTISNHLQPFLMDFCWECHDSISEEAGLDLEKYWKKDAMYEDRIVWEKVMHMLREREMPPDKAPAPTEELRIATLEFIQMKLDEFTCEGLVQPGRVTIRRLNRNEYANTIFDLLGVEFEATADFPADEVGYGFDNIGDVLSLSPLQMERYLDAAIKITNEAVLSEIPQWPPVERYEAESFVSQVEDDGIRPSEAGGAFMGLYVNGRASKEVSITAPGQYRLRVRAYGEQAGEDPAELELLIDGQRVATLAVAAPADAPEVYGLELPLERAQTVSLGFLNNYNQGGEDRNLFVDFVEIEGPLGGPAPPLPERHTRIIPERPGPGREIEAARQILEKFGTLAYRRPVRPEEVERLIELVTFVLEDEGTFEESIQVALQAVLSSPAFLFRWELDSGDGEYESDGTIKVRALDDYELASRLSYYLWNSMPDEALFEAARRNELSETEELLSQVDRMLADPKSSRFIKNFAGQWLQIRNLDRVAPDPDLFPEFDVELKEAMRMETELLFDALVREDRSILDLLDADFTFLNDRLAAHYGIEGVEGSEFQRYELDPASNRGGVLTHASILTITSNPDRTAPVIRGKWIMEQILGTSPPPPPPNVPELVTEGESDEIVLTSLREKLELHRNKPECSACHEKMDPLGFAFENFDAIGRWRDLDGRASIDPAGVLSSGEAFDDSRELVSILRQQDSFTRTLTEKMLTYALGRGLEYYDKCAVDSIIEHLDSNEYHFSALIAGIVTSSPFRMQQIDGETL